MTDKEKIRAEIERLRKYYQGVYEKLDSSDELSLMSVCAKRNILLDILLFIDSMPSEEEPVSEELEAAADECVDAEDYPFVDRDGNPLYDGDYMKYMFKKGGQWQKQQIMKDAKSGVGNNDNYIQFDDGTWIDLDPSMKLNPAFDIKEGEKVKLIIIREK